MLSKNVNNKRCAPKLIFFNEKKIEKDLDNFWRRKLTLKVRNCQFLITWFRACVDLPEKFSYEKVLFFTQLGYHLMCRLLKKSYMLSNMYLLHAIERQTRFEEKYYLYLLRSTVPWDYQPLQPKSWSQKGYPTLSEVPSPSQVFPGFQAHLE